MTYTYVKARYGNDLSETFDTLDEALYAAWSDNEFEGAYPLDILEDGKVLWSNRGGVPWSVGSCPLLDKIHEWAEVNIKE